MSKVKKAMTLKQIAADLSLSYQTVSTIINGNKQKRAVAPETEKRVLDYVRKTGYHQNLSALSMRGKYSKDIVIVIRELLTHEQRQVYFRLIEQLELMHLSHISTFYVEQSFPQLVREIEFFNPKKIIVFNGILGHKPGYAQWKTLRENYFSHIPCFFFDFSSTFTELLCNSQDAFVDTNRDEAFNDTAAEISGGGFTHLLMHRHPLKYLLADSGLEIVSIPQKYDYVRPANAFYAPGLIEAGTYYARKILEQPFPKGKTAAFLSDDYMCCGAIKYLRENSIKVPEDIEFFSFGYMEENELFKYPFTSWQLPYDGMYREMIRWVEDKKLQQQNFKINKIVHT